jgi:DNA repair ATPase RecN
MAIDTYGVTASDVKERAPVDTRPIPGSATAGRLDDTDIEGWIDEGASEMSGIIEQSRLDASDLADEARQQVATAVEHYAAAELLSAIGHTGSSYDSIRERYEEIRDRLESDPNRLDRQQSRVRSNVDRSADKKSPEFEGVRYDY